MDLIPDKNFPLELYAIKFWVKEFYLKLYPFKENPNHSQRFLIETHGLV